MPFLSYTVTPDSVWQTNDLTWEFGYAQPDFQIEILLECQGTGPVWVDGVGVSVVGAADDWNL